MAYKPPHLPDHYTAGESQKGMIYSYLLFLWYVRLDRTGVNKSLGDVVLLLDGMLRGCRGILPQCEDARNRSNVST